MQHRRGKFYRGEYSDYLFDICPNGKYFTRFKQAVIDLTAEESQMLDEIFQFPEKNLYKNFVVVGDADTLDKVGWYFLKKIDSEKPRHYVTAGFETEQFKLVKMKTLIRNTHLILFHHFKWFTPKFTETRKVFVARQRFKENIGEYAIAPIDLCTVLLSETPEIVDKFITKSLKDSTIVVNFYDLNVFE